jgi:predicted DNA binding CopG/RHH family protein
MSEENMNDAFKLDKEEQWYEDHADEFEPASPELREQLIQAAETTRNKTERMNIRMKKADMDKLKHIALREGIPYQSLVTSIIHKYIAGSFVDIQEAKKIFKLNSR